MTRLQVLAMMGLPGCGKSSLARPLAQTLGWPIVDRDAIRAAMFPQASGTATEKAAALDAVFDALSVHLDQAQSCIVDGMTFATEAYREELRRRARAAGARSLLLMLDCPVDVAAARVEAQGGHSARERNAALVRAVAQRFAPLTPDIVHLDATQPASALLARALTLVRTE